QNLALCGRWQQDPEVGFEAFSPIPGNPGAVAQYGHHADRRLVIFFLARLRWSGGGVHVAAQVAAQLFQLIYGRSQWGLPLDPHQHAWFALRINLATTSVWARIPGL